MSELVAFFSQTGKNYVNGEILNLDVGNTELAAEFIQEATGAGLYKIEPVVAYSIGVYRGSKGRSAQKCKTGLKASVPRHGALFGHLFRLSQLLGDHADADIHFFGELQAGRKNNPPFLHP